MPASRSTSLDKKLSRTTSSKSSSIRSGKSLDIKQVIQGQFVVKPQDMDNVRADIMYMDELQQLKDELDRDAKDPEASQRGSASRTSVGHYSLGPHR